MLLGRKQQSAAQQESGHREVIMAYKIAVETNLVKLKTPPFFSG